jgi:hypothetical protein
LGSSRQQLPKKFETDSVLRLPQLHSKVHNEEKWNADRQKAGNLEFTPEPGTTCLDEVKYSITMPEFNAKVASCKSDHSDIIVDAEVMKQLRKFVTTIASMYNNNPCKLFAGAWPCHPFRYPPSPLHWIDLNV